MGYVYCPECGYEISDQETKCPFCDTELERSDDKSTVGNKDAQSTKSSEQVYRVYQDLPKDKAKHDYAETVIGTIASIHFWVGAIVSFIVFMVGLYNLLEGTYIWSEILGASLMGISIVLFLLTLVFWASLKLMVNISRNLFVIKETLAKDKKISLDSAK